MKRILIALLLCPLSISASNIKDLATILVRVFQHGCIKALAQRVELPALIDIAHASTDHPDTERFATHKITCEITAPDDNDGIQVDLISTHTEVQERDGIQQTNLHQNTQTFFVPIDETKSHTCRFEGNKNISLEDIVVEVSVLNEGKFYPEM